MIVIRTAEDMARTLASPLEPTLKSLLQDRSEHLAEWDLQELAILIIVQPHDTIDAVERAFGEPLVGDAKFTKVPELISQHREWIEVVFILSDDGFGLVLYVWNGSGADAVLLNACRRHLLRAL